METKLINPGNLSSIRSNLCNKRWNSTINSCCKQRIYFCSIQRNTCLPSNILKTHLHHNSALLFTDSESKHFSNMAGNAKMKWHPGSRARFQLSNGKKNFGLVSQYYIKLRHSVANAKTVIIFFGAQLQSALIKRWICSDKIAYHNERIK